MPGLVVEEVVVVGGKFSTSDIANYLKYIKIVVNGFTNIDNFVRYEESKYSLLNAIISISVINFNTSVILTSSDPQGTKVTDP